MRTILYLIRHSLKFDNSKIIDYKTSESKIIRSEKIVLSVEGERRAKILSKCNELKSMDKVYCSNCVRTLETAKYLLEEQDLNVIIDERLDEKRVGIYNEKEYPNWFNLQYEDENYKTINGESQKEVRERMNECIDEILLNNRGKRIAIFSHGYAITFFLLKYARLDNLTSDRVYTYSFNGKKFLDDKLEAPMIFKLTFDDDKIVDIENIKIDFDEVI